MVTHGDNIMYRISKVLNHNTVIGIHADDNQEYLVMGKGIGFGKKVSERFEVRDGDTVYSLQATSNRGNAKELATSIQPIYLEIANEILDEAEKVFQNIDRAVLFPMADHLEYAVKRIQNHEQISNPLTDDIRVLFHLEYKTAECVRPILKERLGITLMTMKSDTFPFTFIPQSKTKTFPWQCRLHVPCANAFPTLSRLSTDQLMSCLCRTTD